MSCALYRPFFKFPMNWHIQEHILAFRRGAKMDCEELKPRRVVLKYSQKRNDRPKLT